MQSPDKPAWTVEEMRIIDELKLLLGLQGVETTHGRLELGVDTFFLIFCMPPLLTVPVFILSWLNPCVGDTYFLRVVTLSLFAACFMHTWAQLMIFSSNTWFCSKVMMRNHHLHTAALFASMGATLGFFTLFTHTSSFVYVACLVASFIVCFVEYFICLFQRQNFRTCAIQGKAHHTCNGKAVLCNNTCNYEDLFTWMGVAFFFLWMSAFVVGAYYSKDLQGTGVPSFCMNSTNVI